MGDFFEIFVYVVLGCHGLGLFHSLICIYNPSKDVCKIFGSCSFVMNGVGSALNNLSIQ